MSVVVDTVSEVLDIPADAIEEPPMVGAGEGRHFIQGIAKDEKGIKVLLDVLRDTAQRRRHSRWPPPWKPPCRAAPVSQE
jgi:chemotaxis signal transduction protein